MSTDFVTRAEFEALLARVNELEAKGNDKPKKSPKQGPISIIELVANLEKGVFMCTHCYKTGANKNKFCASVTKLHYDGKPYDEEINVDKEDYFRFRCAQHSKGSNNKAIDLGKKMLESHYGQNDDGAVVKEEDDPSQTVASILTNNPVDLPTTPSKAKNKLGDDYIDQGEYLDKKIKTDDGDKVVFVRYKKNKSGTPSKRPTPRIIGQCEIDDVDDYLNNLSAPEDSSIKKIGLNYEPINKTKASDAEVVADDFIPGLTTTEIKQPVVVAPEKSTDAYDAPTDEENGDDTITDLLEELKR